ncbi:phage tail protein [Halpernia frigidisoli]|nr:tail fiber protein [Halpernia frigidisoli]
MLGQIIYVPYNFAPQGWLDCNGQILQISEYDALFSLIGTTYGGDGQITFALPDTRGRVMIHNGQSQSTGTIYSLGQKGGSESVTLAGTQMPAHTHVVAAVTATGNSAAATGNLPANTKTLDQEYSDTVANTTMKSTMLSETGGNQPHENRPPFMALKCIIATQGIYPSRP